MKNKILKAALAVAVLGLPLQLQAYPITIQNAGFESPVTLTTGPTPTSWTALDIGGSGVWNINADPAGFWTVPAPEGNQIAFLSSAPHPGSPAGLSQVLTGNTLAANTTYNLSGWVGHPLGFSNNGVVGPGFALTIYTASLYAGGNLLNSVSGTGPEAFFVPFSLTFDSTGSAFVGQTLEVRLESNQAQTGFDAISLTAPDGGLTALLLGMSMMGLGWMRRKMR